MLASFVRDFTNRLADTNVEVSHLTGQAVQ